jgi:hypothetical protein
MPFYEHHQARLNYREFLEFFGLKESCLDPQSPSLALDKIKSSQDLEVDFLSV